MRHNQLLRMVKCVRGEWREEPSYGSGDGLSADSKGLGCLLAQYVVFEHFGVGVPHAFH